MQVNSSKAAGVDWRAPLPKAEYLGSALVAVQVATALGFSMVAFLPSLLTLGQPELQATVGVLHSAVSLLIFRGALMPSVRGVLAGGDLRQAVTAFECAVERYDEAPGDVSARAVINAANLAVLRWASHVDSARKRGILPPETQQSLDDAKAVLLSSPLNARRAQPQKPFRLDAARLLQMPPGDRRDFVALLGSYCAH